MSTAISSTDITPRSSVTDLNDLVIAQLRAASLRARAFVAEVDSIGVALGGKFISADCAIAWATDIGFHIVVASSAHEQATRQR